MSGRSSKTPERVGTKGDGATVGISARAAPGPRPMSCNACAVRHQALCGALSDDEIIRLNSIARFKHFAAGQVINRDHEDPGYFANVVSGMVKLIKTLPDGRQQIVGLLFPADFLGRPLRPCVHHLAEAASDATLCTFERKQFERLLLEFPGIEHRILEHTLDDLDAAQDWMLLLGRKSASEKLASFLLMYLRRLQQVGCHPPPTPGVIKFDLALSRSEIADYLGLTIETVSRRMAIMKRSGLIVLEGTRTVLVPDIGKLRQAAAEGSD